MLLDYAETYPNEVICYKASNMVLHVDSDMVYLTIPEATRFYDGNFYINNWHSTCLVKTTPKRNSPIHT